MWQSKPTGKLKRRWPKSLDHYSPLSGFRVLGLGHCVKAVRLEYYPSAYPARKSRTGRRLANALNGIGREQLTQQNNPAIIDTGAPWTHRWCALLPGQKEEVLIQAYNRLRHRYAEPHRAYHTFEHIKACLNHLDRNWTSAKEPILIELALWYHDTIYDPRAPDNEDRSAQLAVQELASLGVLNNDLARIKRLIEVTKHPSEPEDEDEALLLDIDLAILGAPEQHYDRYEADVRKEYSWVPWSLYCQGRGKLLISFLEQPALFRTVHFAASHEEQARANLRRAISTLGK